MIRKLSHVKQTVLKETYEYDTIGKAFEHCKLMELDGWGLDSGIECTHKEPFQFRAEYKKVIQ